MKKSISNIAWPHSEDIRIFSELARRKWDAVEIAPSRVWEDFTTISRVHRREYLSIIQAYGLRVCSLHSLFYGIPDAKIFGTDKEKTLFTYYLKKLVELSVDLGAGVLVLGSPVVRDCGSLSMDEAIIRAADTIRESAEYANQCGVCILIEALTKEETTFVNTHKEANQLIQAVNSPGFGLHLDAKSIHEEKETLDQIILSCNSSIKHFHINEPGLTEIGMNETYHKEISESLRKIDYSDYVSIEMRQSSDYFQSIARSLDYVEKIY